MKLTEAQTRYLNALATTAGHVPATGAFRNRLRAAGLITVLWTDYGNGHCEGRDVLTTAGRAAIGVA